MGAIKNIFTNMFKPGYFPVMFNKVIKRLREPNPRVIKKKASEWYDQKAEDTLTFMGRMNPALVRESVLYNDGLQAHGQQVLSTLPVKMGGGGNCVLLYFLARHLEPSTIVETGVSMGFSSHAFLSAIQKNSKGHLYSSDFPYFRIENPETYIGCVVAEHLKKPWSLFIEGDHINLPRIVSQIKHIDLFHYDSDKSYAGRSEALKILNDKLTMRSTIVFDDIGDNFHFRDWVEQKGLRYQVLRNPNGGFVGITGSILTTIK
jgi:hypothetical protein